MLELSDGRTPGSAREPAQMFRVISFIFVMTNLSPFIPLNRSFVRYAGTEEMCQEATSHVRFEMKEAAN